MGEYFMLASVKTSLSLTGSAKYFIESQKSFLGCFFLQVLRKRTLCYRLLGNIQNDDSLEEQHAVLSRAIKTREEQRKCCRFKMNH